MVSRIPSGPRSDPKSWRETYHIRPIQIRARWTWRIVGIEQRYQQQWRSGALLQQQLGLGHNLLAIHTIVPLSSWGSAILPIGISLSQFSTSSLPSFSSNPLIRSVLMYPGLKLFTLIPLGPHSVASDLASICTALFEVLYAACF
jgi:hypothetical protein